MLARLARFAFPAAAMALLAACAAQPPVLPEDRQPTAAPVADQPIPAFWTGAFTMVEANGARVGPGQFRLELGRQGPNHFRATRGCYIREGWLKRRGEVWIVEPRGDVRADPRCLATSVGAAQGSPGNLFEHRAVTLSPSGRERWISEGNARWLYIMNPPSPPGQGMPPPPPPPAVTRSPAMAPWTGFKAVEFDAMEALYRHQIVRNASGGQRNVARLCLGAGPNLEKLGDPPAPLLARFKGDKPPVSGVSACHWIDDTHWADKATGGNALVHYIDSFSCQTQVRCVAHGGYLEGNMSASGNRYVIERKNGRWKVTGDVMEWIS